eukprot:CAMPEP_0172855604 /NCGR_PEP_ID=MMETSP1075-20121228/62023_1 /TAXON_ID=2916 /ORGANISM="Ceratium fusus, Strain PA161109" /LENGTH=58 /DNA_ID=CAMNT_0013702593 /DNA_START=69 /DNA_END=241 /DNA_ORIENTATION=+
MTTSRFTSFLTSTAIFLAGSSVFSSSTSVLALSAVKSEARDTKVARRIAATMPKKTNA